MIRRTLDIWAVRLGTGFIEEAEPVSPQLFRRLKRFQGAYDKLDGLFAAFVLFALIVEAPRFSVSVR